ncbi:uncharacterized protein M437DRAFT_88173 [Aureobasidium melanogenum CBS 110374]|uniref:Uncharacterized protein n=1 Tax=Aureobasidium melanogenum (strain CBS 110374) TaxID=1043003 RepID=A0A074VMJ1_AURM1|nr:uncharacterized protein M437DRAFT_88173 [Aureobasidium melanogenum CBS 110374]KEQ58907.1 hypothetical protein M437DRAFT_88173 [Aureobasidium melanogenum CBS 110374]
MSIWKIWKTEQLAYCQRKFVVQTTYNLMGAFHVPSSYHQPSNSKQHKLLLAVFHESGLAAQETLYMNADGVTVIEVGGFEEV